MKKKKYSTIHNLYKGGEIHVVNGDINNCTINIGASAACAKQEQRTAEEENYEERIKRAVNESIMQIMPLMTCSRHWFPIIKVLMEHHIVPENDFGFACRFVKSIVSPELIHYKIDPKDLARLNVLSMRKNVEHWDVNNCEVGTRLPEYKALAVQYTNFLVALL